MSRQQVVITFGLSLATLKRWLILQRRAAPLTPKVSSGRRRTLSLEHQPSLWAQLEAGPDATLAEHTQRWNTAHAVRLSSRTLGRAIQRLGWTRKKRRWVLPNATSRREQRIAPA
jgi:transposase